MRSSLLILTLLLAGCTTHPLGEDWETLEPQARDERAVEVLTKLVAGGVGGAGAPFKDREVLRCDREGVSYRPTDAEEGEVASNLAWAEIESIDAQPVPSSPARPEDLHLYLRKGQGKGARDRVVPTLARAGLSREYVLLRSRPRWARTRLLLALDHLRQARSAKPPAAKPDAPAQPAVATEPAKATDSSAAKPGEPADPNPPADPVEPAQPDPSAAPEAAAKPDPGATPPTRGSKADLDALEAKLERLKSWRAKGLIDEEEYQRKRSELLERL